MIVSWLTNISVAKDSLQALGNCAPGLSSLFQQQQNHCVLYQGGCNKEVKYLRYKVCYLYTASLREV